MREVPGRGRALVIGAGIGGLCAARALADHFAEVIVLDRDVLPDGPRLRRRLPQGGFVHVLLGRCQRLLDGWFPGLDAAMDELGAPHFDWADETSVFHLGDWMPRFQSDLRVRPSTRGALEFAVRGQLERLPNVVVRPSTRVLGPCTDRSGALVGLIARPEAGSSDVGADVRLEGDLVVDCSGRASRAQSWLEGMGLPVPPVREIRVKTTYATRLYEGPTVDVGFRCMYVMHQGVGQPRSGLIYPIEHGRWGVNLFAYDGSPLPDDEEGFDAFARTLVRPELAEALRTCEPVGSIRRYRATGNRMVQFGAVRAWPARLAVLGDAACALNPVYGQGMTLAAMSAELLGAMLGEGGFVAHKFQRRLAKLQQGPWQMSTLEDLRWPSTTGATVDLRHRALMAWTDRIHTVAQRDLALYKVLADVIHLVRPATELALPSATLRVVRGSLSRARPEARAR